MQDVRAQYAELKATLSTFQASVGDCLERAEAEFLQAYRAHMVEVHRELQQLRAQLGSAEASLRDDDGVRELEASGAWYRGEAAQQAAHVAALRKDRTYARRNGVRSTRTGGTSGGSWRRAASEAPRGARGGGDDERCRRRRTRNAPCGRRRGVACPATSARRRRNTTRRRHRRRAPTSAGSWRRRAHTAAGRGSRQPRGRARPRRRLPRPLRELRRCRRGGRRRPRVRALDARGPRSRRRRQRGATPGPAPRLAGRRPPPRTTPASRSTTTFWRSLEPPCGRRKRRVVRRCALATHAHSKIKNSITTVTQTVTLPPTSCAVQVGSAARRLSSKQSKET